MARDDQEGVLQAVTLAGWPERGPEGPAFLEGGAVLCVTDAEADVWLPRALRIALCQRRYRPRLKPPPQPKPPRKRRRK